MVTLMYQQKNFSKGAHTPGDIDGMTNQGLYLSPDGKSITGAESYIPAFKPGSARRLPMTDAFNTEAQQLKDAELDLRTGSKYEKVFGNGLFEGGEGLPSPGTKSNGSMIKMNSFFADASKQAPLQGALSSGRSLINSDNSRDVTPDRGPGSPGGGMGLVARRNASTTNVSGRVPSSLGPNARLGEPGTEVQAFNDPDELPVVARPRIVIPSSQQTNTYAAWESQLKQLIASGRREEAVRMPAVPGRMVRCYVKRVKNFFSTHCCFQMFMDTSDVFLLAARRRKKSKTSSYVVSLDLDDLKRDTGNCMAKLKANFVGTEYTLWGRSHGAVSGRDSPTTPAGPQGNEAQGGYSREDLVINFKQTALNKKGGPRSMYVVLPEPSQELQSPEHGGSESLSHMLELARKRELPPFLEKKVSIMSTKLPEYDPNMKAYTLDFQGRVKEASVKNFQLTTWDHNTDRTSGDVILQFGKQADDAYALDFTYPFNVELAFSLALATIDTKLCYTI